MRWPEPENAKVSPTSWLGFGHPDDPGRWHRHLICEIWCTKAINQLSVGCLGGDDDRQQDARRSPPAPCAGSARTSHKAQVRNLTAAEVADRAGVGVNRPALGERQWRHPGETSCRIARALGRPRRTHRSSRSLRHRKSAATARRGPSERVRHRRLRDQDPGVCSIGSDDLHAGPCTRTAAAAPSPRPSPTRPRDLATPGAYAIDPELPLSSGARQTRLGSAMFGAPHRLRPRTGGEAPCSPPRSRPRAGEGRTTRTSRDRLRARRAGRPAPRRLRLRVDDGPSWRRRHRRPHTDRPARTALTWNPSANDTADLPDLQRPHPGRQLAGRRPSHKAHVRDTTGRIAIAKFPPAQTATRGT